ncbi:hypothetical protein H8356DRAFT_1334158 [Neocallimastix lanati (nom. inval.)]|nr:hypothetical protein H8356DRAFT_1334158 [Neocallimastix sp. JGI-2020a]
MRINSYIIAAAKDGIAKLNRPLTLDEYVKLVKKKYWRENKKYDKLRQLKRIIIELNETIYEFNSRYLDLYD